MRHKLFAGYKVYRGYTINYAPNEIEIIDPRGDIIACGGPTDEEAMDRIDEDIEGKIISKLNLDIF